MGVSSARSIHLDALAALVGTANLQTEFDTPWQSRLQGAVQPNCQVSAIVYPETVTQLAEVVKLCHKQHWSLIPCGAGSKLDWGGLVGGVPELLLVSTARLKRLVDHAVGDLSQ
jgi:glycolate oxidase FAD binding subunit